MATEMSTEEREMQEGLLLSLTHCFLSFVERMPPNEEFTYLNLNGCAITRFCLDIGIVTIGDKGVLQYKSELYKNIRWKLEKSLPNQILRCQGNNRPTYGELEKRLREYLGAT